MLSHPTEVWPRVDPPRVNVQDGELFWEPEEKAHQEQITDLQLSEDGTYFVTSSKDKSAKVPFSLLPFFLEPHLTYWM